MSHPIEMRFLKFIYASIKILMVIDLSGGL